MATEFCNDPELGICDDGYMYTRIINGVLYSAVNEDELFDIIADD